MKAVILAGGGGTRLWPLSRNKKPKQFHCFFGNATMLQQTYTRLNFLKPKDIFIATNAQYEKLVREQLPHVPQNQIIIEPASRDTGPCICHAANFLAKRGFENEVMAIVYADHLIQKPAEFRAAMVFAEKNIQTHDVSADILAAGILNVIAVRAKNANPTLGYIKIGARIKTQIKMRHGSRGCKLAIFELDKFVEKPDAKTAAKFLRSNKYLWNTGLYMWKVGTILREFKNHAPKIYKAVVEDGTYERAPKISIDFAVIEKIAAYRMYVVCANLGWNDIGNWKALHEELACSSTENISRGEHLAIDTKGCVVFGQSGKLIATYGVKNLAIIDTASALLVLDKNRACEMKKITKKLQKSKKGKFL